MAEPNPKALSRQLAADLLSIGAVALRPEDPFTWSSGLKAPLYCDNRLTLAYPSVRARIAEGFAADLHRHSLHPQVIAGTATAGIPHAAWLADRLDLPMAYVRAQAKAHGRGNQIEGRIEPGQSVVVVEDLVSTGGSSLAAVEAVRSTGAEVLAVLAIFSYGLPAAAEAFTGDGVPLYPLTDLEVLLDVAREQERLSPEALEALRTWQQDPEGWAEG